jgi:hypothetical protein
VNTSSTHSSSISSNKRFDLGCLIQDSIFYFEDLMGDQNDLPVSHNKAVMQEKNHDLDITQLFNQVVSENQYNISDPKREETIRALLYSIESFSADSKEHE